MTPEVIGALVNLGSAGAVIVVVMIFLKANEKRDDQWQSFFTTLNADSKNDLCKLAETMERMVKSLDTHDLQAKAIKEAVARIEENTQPIDPHPRKRSGL